MEALFVRTGERRYAVEIRRAGGTLRMDPAPGFDDHCPHDLMHLIVEEQLGLTGGIFGRLAKGGTASTFVPVGGEASPDKRTAARRRRELRRRDRRIADVEPPEFGRSERATVVAWHDWLQSCTEPELRRLAASKADTASQVLDRMDESERAHLNAALPRMRRRTDEIARRWNALAVGEQLSIVWSPAIG